jgi:glycosyltransferase involved in cell wall biosynthesis
MTPQLPNPKRADLHCHSDASNRTGEAVLNALRCPESYSRPQEVYAQARLRGMDFVTLTDHDSIEGALEISGRSDVLVGEELTCWFPEDHCKMHVLVYGIDSEQHERLQELARNIYDVAAHIEHSGIAHSVAHPIYRQNDKLERWHVERLLLLFKGFECLNGAHSPLHREAFEPMLDRLTRQEIARLSDTHGLAPRWPEPHFKARTAGSDDHGLLNVGRTFTEFPPNIATIDQLLACLRNGTCAPGGEAGSSAKLAHTFYSVAIRYYSRHIMTADHRPNIATTLVQTIAGERKAPSKAEIARLALKSKLRKLTRRVISPFAKTRPEARFGTTRLKKLFLQSSLKQIQQSPQLRAILERGLPPLGEHEDLFALVSEVNRDVTRGIADAINHSVDDASFTGLFDTIGSAIAQQFVLLPYYFAVFHQNKERHLLREITRQQRAKTAQTLKVGLFTDTFDEMNGVGRFVRDMCEQAKRSQCQMIVHTCSDSPRTDASGYERKNFAPLLSRTMPLYEELPLHLPPLLEILDWADRQQFDAIHVSTPGSMGLCGWVAAKMLRVPMLATYHTDFPAYVDRLARDHRVTNGTITYIKWFYNQASAVFSRSSSYLFNLRDLGLPDARLRTIVPGIDTERFSPRRSDAQFWTSLGVGEPRRLLYTGRVSVEKNLPMLVEAFKRLCARRRDVALVVAGDGPYLQTMRSELAALPAYLLGRQDDASLAALYAGSDLFVFPSRTDTLGQVVMESQACGLPALVTNEGGPKENVEDGVTGIVMTSDSPADWCDTIRALLDDPAKLKEMSKASAIRGQRCSLARTFESFWADHVAVVEPPRRDEEGIPAPPRTPARV